MKEKILIVGQFPPPYHGSNVMAKVMVSALDGASYQTIFLDKRFSKTIETIGKPSARKILRIPVLVIELLIACLFKQPALCIYFIAVGKSAFLLDAFFLYFLRICRLPYILRFGGKGYSDLQREGFMWKFLVTYTLSNSLGGIVLGETMKWDVNPFIPNDRLVCVPNGLQDQPIVSNGSHNKCVKVLFLSNLVPSKGPLEFLRAANILVKQNTNVRFVLAGADSSLNFTKQLRSYIINNGLEEYVTTPGSLHGDEKERLMASSDIFVFPTYYKNEVFGNVNIEAMRSGLPVISSNEGAIPESVRDGITGFIVNPKDPREIAAKILILVNDPKLRAKMGKKGRELFESKYTLEVYAKVLDDAIQSLLSRLNV
jgi:glycosyltransferase involved in cell wall biosynthesis